MAPVMTPKFGLSKKQRTIPKAVKFIVLDLEGLAKAKAGHKVILLHLMDEELELSILQPVKWLRLTLVQHQNGLTQHHPTERLVSFAVLPAIVS